MADKFDDKYIATIGTKVTKKELHFKSEDGPIFLTLMIWDVLGQKGYKTVQSSSFKGADGVILVCDFTRQETLSSLEEYWLPSIGENLSNLKLVFVANKSDLTNDARFSLQELQNMASKYGSEGFSSSAKTGENVENLFLNLGRMLTGIKVEEEGKELEIAEELPSEMTIVAVADFVINDFCNNYGDMEIAMPIIRQQFARAGVDIQDPTKEGLSKVIDLLAEVEEDFRDRKTVSENRTKRQLLLERVKS